MTTTTSLSKPSPRHLDPAIKEWLDKVIIPILVAELARRDVELAA
jgi:hypothetical protein